MNIRDPKPTRTQRLDRCAWATAAARCALLILAVGAATATATAQTSSSGLRSSAATAPIGPLPGPAREPDGPSNPYADDKAALQEGRQLFKAFNCAGCHGAHAGGGMGPSLRDELWLYGSAQHNIYSSIAQGRANGMPAWGALLPEPEIWKLAAYIGSLRTDREPEPPR